MANASDAMKALNLNRSDIYTIRLSRSKGASAFALTSMGYSKVLNKVKDRLASGANDKNGVRCNITTSGAYKCVYIK